MTNFTGPLLPSTKILGKHLCLANPANNTRSCRIWMLHGRKFHRVGPGAKKTLVLAEDWWEPPACSYFLSIKLGWGVCQERWSWRYVGPTPELYRSKTRTLNLIQYSTKSQCSLHRMGWICSLWGFPVRTCKVTLWIRLRIWPAQYEGPGHYEILSCSRQGCLGMDIESPQDSQPWSLKNHLYQLKQGYNWAVEWAVHQQNPSLVLHSWN